MLVVLPYREYVPAHALRPHSLTPACYEKFSLSEPNYAIKSLVPESQMVLRMAPERLYGLVEE